MAIPGEPRICSCGGFPGSTFGSVSSLSGDDKVLSLLREMAQEMTDCRRYLGRLVELEEERREGERQMEALAEALLPVDAESEPATLPDWYRNSSGYFLERGTDRPLTDEEVMRVTFSPRREARERRSR